MIDSQNLVAEYVRTASESAFRELVARYVNLVYSTALRVVGGDTHLAEDVAQTVFVHLARKAHGLSNQVMLGGWLHRATLNVATTVARGESRRKSRERQSAEMNTPQDHTEANLAHLAPVLDEAIDKLNAEDRSAILLRFFEQLDFRSVGERLDTNEDAARKRVTRALEKLQSFLKHRGVSLSATALGAALATEAITAAPAGLATSIAATVLAGAAEKGAALTLTKFIGMRTLQKTLVSAVLTVAVGAAIYEARQTSALRAQFQTLQKPLETKIQAMTRDRDDATSQVAALRDDNQRLTRETTELPKLRGQVAELRAEAQHSRVATSNLLSLLSSVAQDIRTNSVQLRKVFDVQALRDVGTKTQEDTLQTLLYALSSHDAASFRQACLNPGRADQLSSFFDSTADQLKGLSQIIVRREDAFLDGSVRFQCDLVWTEADATNNWRWLSVLMKATDGGWGWDGFSPSGISTGNISRRQPVPQTANQQ